MASMLPRAAAIRGVAHGRRLIYRSSPIDGSGVDVSAVVQQQAGLGFVVQAPEERCGFPLVAGVRVGSVFEEQLHGREVAKAGGVLERRVTGPVVRIDQFGAGGDQLLGGF
jgi:hypothetical protein